MVTRRVLLSLACIFLCAGFCFAQETTRPLTDYKITLQEARTFLNSRPTTPTAQERIGEFKADLRGIQAVQLPDGAAVSLDSSALVQALDRAHESDARTKSAQSALDAAIFLATEKPDSKSTVAGDANAEAGKILSEREFVDAAKKTVTKKNWLEEQMQRALKALGEWIGDMLGRFRPGRGANLNGFGEMVKWLFFFVVSAIAGVALYFLVQWLVRLIGSRNRKAQRGIDADLSDDTIADPLARARQLAAEGELRQAVRMAYIASLRRLRDTGLLILEPNKTNWEYQRSLRGRSPSAHDALLPATRIFDRVWYGFLPVKQYDFDTILKTYEALPISVTDAEATRKSIRDNGGDNTTAPYAASSPPNKGRNPW